MNGAFLDPDLAGIFANGYDPEYASQVFSEIGADTGISIVCGWEYMDEAGYGGDSEFYIIDARDALYELDGDLWGWLSGDIPADRGPGDPATWKGPKTDIDVADVPVWDGGHFAFEDRM